MAEPKKKAPVRKRAAAKPAVPVTVESAAVSGDRRRLLEAIRDRLARDLDLAPAVVSAQLAAQLRATSAELDSLPAPEETSVIDQIAARRAARRAAAKQGNAAAGSGQ